MRSKSIIHTVSCHCEGEVGDVIVGGVMPPPGATLYEQRDFLARDETLRNFMLNEPRGGVFRHFNLLVPPKHPDGRRGVPDHGAGGHSADVRLEHDLRRDGAAGDRHPADGGAGDEAHPRSAGGPRVGRGALPLWQGAVGGIQQCAVLRRQAFGKAGGGGAGHDHGRYGLWRRRLRHYKCADAWICNFTGRGGGPCRARRADHLCGERAARLPASDAGVGPHLVLPVHRAADEDARPDGAARTRWRSSRRSSTARPPAPAARRGWRCCMRAERSARAKSTRRSRCSARISSPASSRRRASTAARRLSRASKGGPGLPARTSISSIRTIRGRPGYRIVGHLAADASYVRKRIGQPVQRIVDQRARHGKVEADMQFAAGAEARSGRYADTGAVAMRS